MTLYILPDETYIWPAPGWVYVVEVRAVMRGLVKVGMTYTDPIRRINAVVTANRRLMPRKVRAFAKIRHPHDYCLFPVFNVWLAESAAHTALAQRRLPGPGELFRIGIEEAKPIIEVALMEYHHVDGQ